MVYVDNCLWLLINVCHLAVFATLPLEDSPLNRNQTETLVLSLSTRQNNNTNKTKTLNDVSEDDKTFNNTEDNIISATVYKPQQHFPLPIIMKPRGFNLPKIRAAQRRQDDVAQPAAQNYYNNFFPHIHPLGHSRPYYHLTEDPLIAKFLSQQTKQFQPENHGLTAYDASILGSGDFGVLKGGTFYSDDETSYSNDEASDFYYGDASNSHIISSTEGFIQKYTYPEEQFAQFRDFADLSTPSDSAYSQYVVVYAAKNSTSSRENSKPKNIFDQLQEIDKEKALEEKKLKKNQTNSSITKLKLVKTKIMEKKWVQKQPVKVMDDDPLLALS